MKSKPRSTDHCHKYEDNGLPGSRGKDGKFNMKWFSNTPSEKRAKRHELEGF